MKTNSINFSKNRDQLVLYIWSLGFTYCFGFRYYNLEFPKIRSLRIYGFMPNEPNFKMSGQLIKLDMTRTYNKNQPEKRRKKRTQYEQKLNKNRKKNNQNQQKRANFHCFSATLYGKSGLLTGSKQTCHFCNSGLPSLINWTGPSRPEGNSSPGLLVVENVYRPVLYSLPPRKPDSHLTVRTSLSGSCWSPRRRLGQRLATSISSTLPLLLREFVISTRQGQHHTTPTSLPLSLTRAIS